MTDTRKQAISIRMNTADLQKIKQLARRLGSRDSDVVRFAVKMMIARLGPLCDPDVGGRHLLPVFVESGTDLLRFFELDDLRLRRILNDGVEPFQRVELEDIALLALSSGPNRYAELRLSELISPERSGRDGARVSESLREYLYDKYLHRGLGEPLLQTASPAPTGPNGVRDE